MDPGLRRDDTVVGRHQLSHVASNNVFEWLTQAEQVFHGSNIVPGFGLVRPKYRHEFALAIEMQANDRLAVVVVKQHSAIGLRIAHDDA